MKPTASEQPDPPRPTPISDEGVDAPTITDTALIFEGGGMRAAYTAAVIEVLLREGLFFDWVGGISAGSSHTLNYVSQDPWRARASFVDIVNDPRFGGWRSWAHGRGYFNAEWIYENSSGPDQLLPLNLERFLANPARVCIGGVDATTGENHYWGKDDLSTLPDIVRHVRASSTMPILMPMPLLDGIPYVDGALGPSGGIALDAAQGAGYEKFFVVTTRPRGYRKAPETRPDFYRRALRRYPAVAEAIIKRPDRYNATLDELDALEAAGKAYVFHPVDMRIENSEKDFSKLAAAYTSGLIQSNGEVGRWKAFLGA